MINVHVLVAVFIATFNLSHGKGHGRFLAEVNEELEDFVTAMNEMRGCGGQGFTSKKKTGIENTIAPMWRTMPNTNGRLNWKSLRYVVHRYFMQQSSLVMRGLEPNKVINKTDTGMAGILAQQSSVHSDSIFAGFATANRDFGLDDASALIATLEMLVFDAEAHLLERAYATGASSKSKALNVKQLSRVLEDYMVHWMQGEDQEEIDILLGNRSILETEVEVWPHLQAFVVGRVHALNFERARLPLAGHGQTILAGHYNFEDAHEIVGGITKTFQHFWQDQCHDMKAQLVAMDKEGTGRVKLSDFYGSGLEQEWRFGESEAYLRDLGALDESSKIRGKQVIIPNYLQAISNCIISTPHYLVCCRNECEEMMSEIELAIGLPLAIPGDILNIVGNMSVPTNALDEAPRLQGALEEQLYKIAAMYQGKIPLHSRLFAQWLHYTFPRECQFPHKIGVVADASKLTTTAYGDRYEATEEEMLKHARSDLMEDSSSNDYVSPLDQWSDDEEFFVDYSQELKAPWSSETNYYSVVFVIAAVAVTVGKMMSKAKLETNTFANNVCKAHMV